MTNETNQNSLLIKLNTIGNYLTVRNIALGATAIAVMIAISAGAEYLIDHKAPAGAMEKSALEAAALAKVPGAVKDITYDNRAGIDIAKVKVETLEGDKRILMNAQTGEILKIAKGRGHNDHMDHGRGHEKHGEHDDNENHDHQKGHGDMNSKMDQNAVDQSDLQIENVAPDTPEQPAPAPSPVPAN